MNPIILIPARMQATRLPGKPLADIGGVPMIVHVMQRAKASAIGRVCVACDDERIMQTVETYGGEAIMTSQDHASGSDRIYEALQRIDPKGAHDIVINIQGDVPTIDPAIISAVLTPLEDTSIAIGTLACEITLEQEKTDPSVVKPVLSFMPSAPANIARALYFTRARAPYGEGRLYHHIGIYAYRRTALETFVNLPPSPLELREKLEQLRALEAGMAIGVAVVDTVPLGVDTPEHLERARELLQKQA